MLCSEKKINPTSHEMGMNDYQGETFKMYVLTHYTKAGQSYVHAGGKHVVAIRGGTYVRSENCQLLAVLALEATSFRVIVEIKGMQILLRVQLIERKSITT